MIAAELTKQLLPDFVKYCRNFGPEQDESFLPDEVFQPGEDDPTVVLIENDKIVGAASLILHPEYRELKKGRLRIFHCINKHKEHYSLLLESLKKYTGETKNIYCFIKDTHEDVREIWEELGFEIERYSWVLSKQIKNVTPAVLPDGYILKPLKDSMDVKSFCYIINTAFVNMAGHRHMRNSMIDEIRLSQGYLNDGLQLLWHKDTPIGTMHLEEEKENEYPLLFIQSLAILPEYQGKGLGRNMLRAALEYGERKNYIKAVLSVNAENEGAANLYLEEGFKKTELFICYNFKL